MENRSIELLAPARDAETGIEAIRHGADAVYIGPPGFGARAAASNSIDDIARLCDYAHNYDARVYATVNTIIYDDELSEVERMVRKLYRAGTDGLIVQDMSLLRLDIPPIDLHASTQCDIRTPERARFLAECGFSQLVLPRELTLEETAAIYQAIPADVKLEAFVHGALCVSYSGDCQASCVTTGRSANRGECAQICRLPYDLIDSNGRVIIAGKHLLSLRDLNRSTVINEMLEAGISSFKIEGRLKDTGYVKNVTACYSQLLDLIIDTSEGRLRRASSGRSTATFVPDLSKSFNRGFTEYFTRTGSPEVKMGSHETPKWRGNPVGRVISAHGKEIKARLNEKLVNGDGLGVIDSSGQLRGFRLNRIEGNRLFAASDVGDLRPGTVIYRNRDKERDILMAGETAQRRIGVNISLRCDAVGRPVIDVVQPGRCSVSVADEDNTPVEPARTPQSDAHRRVLTKTGDTIYHVESVDDRAEAMFIPLSRLSALRRRAFESLDRARLATRPVRLRNPGAGTTPPPLTGDPRLTYHYNISNALARQWYIDAGAESVESALEVQSSDTLKKPGPRVVMTARYCLRRELGSCLRHDKHRQLPDGPLWLRAEGAVRFRLDFDCANCRMRLLTTD